MLAPQEATHASTMRPLPAPTGTEGAQRLAEAWRRIVFTPMRISALNTLSAGISLTAVLPLPVIHLPLTKTMIVLPFVGGLLLVIGNVISNTVIVGGQISARAWGTAAETATGHAGRGNRLRHRRRHHRSGLLRLEG